MPESMLDGLISVYSRHTVRDKSVHSGDDYKQLCDRFSGSPAFDALRSRTERDKKELETQLSGQTPQLQVKLALIGVRRRRSSPSEAQSGFSKLALLSYGESWSATQREYFTTWSERIFGSVDYFLSFTNRNLTPELPNIVNTNHEFFIRSRIDGWDSRDKSRENLLALAVNYLLQSNALTGFFFPEHQDDSYVVTRKLQQECRRALVFIQIVQGAMFIDSPSYCGLEYDAAEGALPPKPRIFILAEERLPAGHIVHPDLWDWYASVSSSASTMLMSTADLRVPRIINHNHAVIKEKVIASVERAIEALYDGVPGS